MKTAILIIMVGLGGGLAVGTSVMAFFTVLGVTVHIIKWSGKKEYTLYFEICMVLASMFSCLVYFTDITIKVLAFLTIPLGLILGIFVGMIAAALTETLDIISIAANQLNIAKWVYLIVLVVLAGKVAGSLVFFLFPGFF